LKKLLIIITAIALLGLAAFYLYQKSGGVQEVELIKLERIKIEQVIPFPKLKLLASANAVLTNPNAIGAEISAVEIDIYVEGKHTTKIKEQLSIEMPANQTFNLPLNFEIPLGKTGFFKDAKEVLTGAWKNQSLRIKTTGVIYAKVLSFDFEVPLEEEEVYLLRDYLPK